MLSVYVSWVRADSALALPEKYPNHHICMNLFVASMNLFVFSVLFGRYNNSNSNNALLNSNCRQ